VVPFIDLSASEPLRRDAGAALLDKIGPAILISHSQGGQLTWLIGDARPGLVKGIVAV
jgi:pimeloyl-ACP methyl ester carboxylesterase